MHPTPTTAPLAPSTIQSISAPPGSWLENYVGAQIAGAASVLALALDEARDGGMSAKTRQRGAELVAEIVKLRNFMVGRVDFDALACRGSWRHCVRAPTVR